MKKTSMLAAAALAIVGMSSMQGVVASDSLQSATAGSGSPREASPAKPQKSPTTRPGGAVRKTADRHELRWATDLRARQRIFDDLKRAAAHELADFIFAKCKFFEVPDLMGDDLKLQIELTINDRGAYENWLPVVEQRGKAAGERQAVKRMVDSLPYGLADAAREFYE